MHYEPGKSYAWYFAYGRGYVAVFAYPGNKRTRYLRDRQGRPIEYTTSVAAIAAAQEQVRSHCEPDIATDREPDEKHVAAKLDVAGWKRQRVEIVRRGAGKQPFFKVRRAIP